MSLTKFHEHPAPAWSLLRLSAAARLAMAGMIVAALWAATLLVIA